MFYLSNIKARDRYSISILISMFPDVSDYHFNNKTLSTQIFLGQQERRMHMCCKKRHLRPLDPTISRGSAAHLRPPHRSAPSNALKTGHTILAQRWILVRRMRGCNNIPPVKSVKGKHHIPKTLCSVLAPPIPCPGCSESFHECTKLGFNSYTLNYWKTIHPVPVLPGWMGGNRHFHPPSPSSFTMMKEL